MGDKYSNSERQSKSKKDNLDAAILGGFKGSSKRSSQTRFSEENSDSRTAVAVDLPKNHTGQEWLDRLFQYFEKYAQDFNRLVEEPHLISACYPPRDQAHENPLVNGNQGVVSTRHWQLAVRLQDNGIAGFILPKSMEQAFLDDQLSFERIFLIEAAGDASEQSWSFDGKGVDYYELAGMAKRFFSLLIERARKEPPIESDENSQTIQSSPTAKPVVIPAPGEQAAFKDLLDFGHGHLTDTASEPASPNQEGGLSGLLKETMLGAGCDNQTAQTNDQGTSNKANGNVNGRETDSNSKEAEMLKTEELTIPAACEMMKRSIDRELEICTKAGMQAFEGQDLPAIERAMKRTRKLKEFKEKLAPVLSAWEQMEHEDE